MTITANRSRNIARNAFLKDMAGASGGASVSWLLVETLAAITFAAGLARSVVAVPHGVRAMIPWLALALAGAVVRGLATMAAVRTGAARARKAKMGLRRRITAAAFRHAPGGSATIGVLMNAAVDEVEAIDGYVARFLPARQAGAIAPMPVLAATAFASPIAAAILTVTLIPFIVAMILAGGAAADESRRQFEALSRLSGVFADRIRALPILLAFGAEAREAARIGAAADEVAGRTLKILSVAFLSSGALEFFAALSVALIAVYAGFNLLGLLPFQVPETLTLAQAFFVLALAPEFYAPMRRLAAAYHDRQAAQTAADRLLSVEHAEPARGQPARFAPQGPPAIRFDHVEIRYPNSEAAAIRDFSLDIGPGQTVALLGPSGSGKSSLLHLLLGLAPLASGRLSVDGRDAGTIGSLSKLAAWVGQSPLIVPGTIRENIVLAKPDASSADFAEAIRGAGLGPLLFRRSLDTILDERGGGLSGGERRRIALARALLKQAPLLLFDEPTAHLDARAERALIATIGAAGVGRTVLIATHSEALAAIADRIVRLETAS
jgi:ATP-binding cassette subfamily C protein CydD